jgi:hypothetical protein
MIQYVSLVVQQIEKIGTARQRTAVSLQIVKNIESPNKAHYSIFLAAIQLFPNNTTKNNEEQLPKSII